MEKEVKAYLWQHDIKVGNKIEEVKVYLRQHGIEADDTGIIEAAIKLTQQLGAGNWTFVCFFKQEERNKK